MQIQNLTKIDKNKLGLLRFEPMNFCFRTSITGEPVDLEKDIQITWVHDTKTVCRYVL